LPADTTLPLPLTGEARNAIPRSSATARTRADASVETVEQSTRIRGAFSGSLRSRPTTCSRSADDVTIVKTTSRSASSTGSSATFAPASTRGSALLRVRFQTVRSRPARPMRAASAAPMCPVPSQPTVSSGRSVRVIEVPHPGR
jgi:hypothetical protein